MMKRYIKELKFIYRREKDHKPRKKKLDIHVSSRAILYIVCLLLLLPAMSVQAATRVQETSDPVVIVIDPGHGGDNEGTIENGFLEKEMNLITAQAMYDELIQFDNVQVYLTRTEDKKMTLKERAEFAAAVDAHFLFSIHYNASGNHTLFGSEVWVSSQTPYNAYGYQFGYCQMLEMQEMGLYLRGIKTRLNDKGTDYYGIIRESVKLSIPAVIIEHCHVDEERDVPFCETEEDWIAFGKADARAVAKYFGLSSSTLSIDYSKEAAELPEAEANVKVQSTLRDETEPDVCMIELVGADYENGYITVQITAADYDSPLLYYDYSIDGGESFCALRMWPEVDVLTGTYKDSFTIKLQIPSGTRPQILVRVYNQADLYTESNTIPFTQTFQYGQEAQASSDLSEENVSNTSAALAETVEVQPANTGSVQNEEEPDRLLTFLEIGLAVVILLFIIVLIVQVLYYHNRRRRRYQRRKDAGDRRNQPR